MNKVLMSEIVKHVFANFLVIESDYVNFDKSKSLMSKDFSLNDKLSFQDENSNLIENKVWGCQISADQQEIKIILANCSVYDNIKEYCMIVQLKNTPAYCLYFNSESELDSMLACTIDGEDWMECQTYLQATFLAGMEQVRDIGLSWNKCTNYQEQFNMLKSFINFQNSIYEDKDAGQES